MDLQDYNSFQVFAVFCVSWNTVVVDFSSSLFQLSCRLVCRQALNFEPATGFKKHLFLCDLLTPAMLTILEPLSCVYSPQTLHCHKSTLPASMSCVLKNVKKLCKTCTRYNWVAFHCLLVLQKYQQGEIPGSEELFSLKSHMFKKHRSFSQGGSGFIFIFFKYCLDVNKTHRAQVGCRDVLLQ